MSFSSASERTDLTLLDTSGVLAAMFPDQRRHKESASALLSAEPPLVLSPFVLAELDYFIARYAGVAVELQMLEQVIAGAYELAMFTPADLEEARGVISKYADQEVGLADASIVVLSRRLSDLDLLTLDQRHFRALRGARGKPFRIVPPNETK